MKSDIEIARSAKLEDIYNIAQKAGIQNDEVIPCGDYKAKISPNIFDTESTSLYSFSYHSSWRETLLGQRPVISTPIKVRFHKFANFYPFVVREEEAC